MKNLLVIISLIIFFASTSANGIKTSTVQSTNTNDTVHIVTNPDLYDITTAWVSKYEQYNSDSKIKISCITAENLINNINESGSIGITKDYTHFEKNKSIWKMPIGRDIIVPVINSQNPFINEILEKGISSEEYSNALTKLKNPNWGNLLNNDQTIPVHFYGVSSETNKPFLAKFLNTEINNIKDEENLEVDKIIQEIQSNKYGLGFCRLADILDVENHKIMEGLILIPIDVNGNNKIDHFENIYKDYNSLVRGVWIGKYPKALYSNIYIFAADQPIKNNELVFLKWIVTEGQEDISLGGYSELILSERQSKVQRLYANQKLIIDANEPVKTSPTSFIILIVGASVLILFIIFRQLLLKDSTHKLANIKLPKKFTESTVTAPNGLFFDKSHTWAFMEKDGFVRIGIDDFLQHVTGEITKVKMKNPGETVKKGESFFTIIQHGKQLNIQSPISGKIMEVNSQLNYNSSVINSSPYSEGWVYVIESGNWLKEIKSLFMGENYRSWLKDEFSRLKHFFSSTVALKISNQLQFVLQDGGEMSDRPMESVGPEIWEEFQTNFINHDK